MAKAIYVEDDPGQRRLLPMVLSGKGVDFKLDLATYEDYNSGAEAIRTAQELDLLITDISMPGGRGYNLISQARERFPNVPAIVLSADTRDLTEARKVVNGTERVFYREKPYDIREFRGLVGQLLKG